MNLAQKQLSISILLAEDDSDDCSFFKEALKEFPLATQLTIVRDGDQLMQHLTSESCKLPQIIFLDVNMPRKNGFECLSEIKQDKKLKELPVVIYTTSFHKKIATLFYEAGAAYYISKPSEISQLKAAVQKTISTIAQGNFQHPPKESFILTEERKNSKSYKWFHESFIIPGSDTTN
jgi:CheY-like chemotaxis protein